VRTRHLTVSIIFCVLFVRRTLQQMDYRHCSSFTTILFTLFMISVPSVDSYRGIHCHVLQVVELSLIGRAVAMWRSSIAERDNKCLILPRDAYCVI